jgi:hypothetical protein
LSALVAKDVGSSALITPDIAAPSRSKSTLELIAFDVTMQSGFGLAESCLALEQWK